MFFYVEGYLVYRIQAYNHKPQRNQKKPLFFVYIPICDALAYRVSSCLFAPQMLNSDLRPGAWK